MAETFENAGELLARFSDEQLDCGFWYLLSDTRALVNEESQTELRRRAIRSFVPLFEQIMAARCTPHLSHLEEKGASPLNSSCYMLWDLLRFALRPESTPLDSAMAVTLQRQLAIPHDACRESALHGIGHLRRDHPKYESEISAIVDDFLAASGGLRPELIVYAQPAKRGEIL